MTGVQTCALPICSIIASMISLTMASSFVISMSSTLLSPSCTPNLLAMVGCGGGTEPVVVDGSSTVFRISKVAQSGFSKANPGAEVIVESHGTGGGFGRYLAGEVDIVDASREAKEEEAKGAVGDLAWTKHKVAYDGITVVVNPANDFVRTFLLFVLFYPFFLFFFLFSSFLLYITL